jgi:Ca-activated chloride channel family protein
MRRAAAALMVAVCAASLSAQQQVFRGGADVVMLNVTVTDRDGRFVSGLAQEDFQIFEDGALQQITNFTRDQQPIALSIVLDTSTSMEKGLPIAQEAAVGFTRRLGAKDLAQVMAFNSRAEMVQDFTADREALEKAIRRTHAGGSTALYNAVYTALSDLKRLRARRSDELRREAIVLLSDGEDTSSLVDYESVMDAAKRSESSVYTIALRPRESGAVRGFNEADFVLRTLAQDTGARTYRVEQISQLPAIYQQIADELANQYTVGYSSKNPKRDGAWRRIVVKTTRPASTPRTKSGYFAPTVSR